MSQNHPKHILGSNYWHFTSRDRQRTLHRLLITPNFKIKIKIVLVVEDQELHVHKWILKSHSPVFKAMFEGNFQEAGQDTITLKEKEYKSMVQFLKILYPSTMFAEARKL